MEVYVEFPETTLTNAILEECYAEIDFKRIEKKLGIISRRVVKDETALDLALEACREIDRADLGEIDFVIYCTQSPEYFLPSTACIIQTKLGLKDSCGAFDYNLGCSGYIYGLAMAKSFIISGVASKVLLVTAETYTKYIHPSDWSNRAIFGDAATASVIGKDDIDKIGEFDLGTDGKGAENLIIKGGAGKANFHQNFERENCFYMNGSEVFKFTLENVPITVNECLKKNNKSIDDIDFVIFHQANAYMLKNLRKKISVPEDKFYVNVETVGNTVSNTIPVALKDSQDRGLIKSGDCVLLCGFGVGYSWGTTIITI